MAAQVEHGVGSLRSKVSDDTYTRAVRGSLAANSGSGVSDATLVRRFQDGDTTAYAELYDRYYPVVERQCRARLGNAIAVEDAVQETFTRVLTKLREFDGGEKIGRYIKRTAKYVALDVAIAESTATVRHVELDAAGPLADVAEIEHQCERRHSAEVVLGSIKRREAQLLTAHHLQDRPVADLAAVLRTTPGTVAVMLHRARASARSAAQSRGIRGVAPLPVWLRLHTRYWRIHRQSASGITNGVASVTAAAVLAFATVTAGAEAAPASRTGSTEAGLLQVRSISEVAPGGAESRAQDSAPGDRTKLAKQRGSQVRSRASSGGRSGNRETVAPIPEVEVPVVGKDVHQRAPENPDYAYGVVVQGRGVRARAGVEVDDEPDQQPMHERICAAATKTPATYCERRR